MAKVQIEIDTYEAETILRGLDQAFRRYESICHDNITEYKRPERMYVERLMETMKEFHDMAAKIGESVRDVPYINHRAIDSFVDMGGNWQGRIQRIQEALDKKLGVDNGS